jgi:hypothetical protein
MLLRNAQHLHKSGQQECAQNNCQCNRTMNRTIRHHCHDSYVCVRHVAVTCYCLVEVSGLAS